MLQYSHNIEVILKVDIDVIHETSNLSIWIRALVPTIEGQTNTTNETAIDRTTMTSMIHVDSSVTVDDNRIGDHIGIETLITIVIEVVNEIEDAIEIEDVSETVIVNVIAK